MHIVQRNSDATPTVSVVPATAALDGVASEHRALLSCLQARPEWRQLTGQAQLRLERAILTAEDPAAEIITTETLAAFGQRIGLGWAQTKRLLQAARRVGLLECEERLVPANDGGKIQGASVWKVVPSSGAPTVPSSGRLAGASSGRLAAPSSGESLLTDRENPLLFQVSKEELSQSGTQVRAEYALSRLDQKHGRVREPGRSLLREALIENELDVHAAYQLAKDARNPIAYLIEIVKNDDHRGLGVVEEIPCRRCGQVKPDVVDRRQYSHDDDYSKFYALCDDCQER